MSDESDLQKKKSLTCVGFAEAFMAKKEYLKAIKFYGKALKMVHSEDVVAQLKRAEYLSKVEALGVNVSTTADAVDSAINSLSDVTSAPIKILPPSISNIVKEKHEALLVKEAMKLWIRRWVYSHVLMRVYKRYLRSKLTMPFQRWRKLILINRGVEYYNSKLISGSLSVWRVRRVNRKISDVSLLIARRHQQYRSLQRWLHCHHASFRTSRVVKSLRLAIITHYIRINRQAITAFKLFRNKSKISSTINKSIVKYHSVKLLNKNVSVLVNYVMNSCKMRRSMRDGVMHYKRRAFHRLQSIIKASLRRNNNNELSVRFFKTKALQRWKLALLNCALIRQKFHVASPVVRVALQSSNWRLTLPANIPYRRTMKRWLSRIYQLANADYSLRQAALYHLVKVFRRLRFNCKIAVNKTLRKNRSSMLCKRRMLIRSFRRLTVFTSRSVQLRYMSTFMLLHKRIHFWRARVDNLFAMKCSARRAQLRFQIQKLAESLRTWYQYADTKRRIRRCFRVFRAMHPLPACSAVRRVFAAWKTDFLKYNKVKKITRRLLLNDRKHRLQSHYFELWFDAFDDRLYWRERQFVSLKKLWVQSQKRRNELHLLVSAVISCRSRQALHTSMSQGRHWIGMDEASFDSYSYAKRMHRSISYESSYNYQDSSTNADLVEFLSFHLPRVEPRRKLDRLYHLCTMRQWFGTWLRFHRDNRVASQRHHQNVSILIDEYKDYVDRCDTVSRKRDLWIQWRRLKVWYQLMHTRQAKLELISLRVLCTQYFRRWIMRYNLQVMEKRLLVPNGYRNLLNVRQNDCLQLQTTAEASHLINKIKHSQFASENVSCSNTNISNSQFSFLNDSNNSSVIHRLIGDGSIDYSFVQGYSVSRQDVSQSVDSSKLSLIKRLSQPKRSATASAAPIKPRRAADIANCGNNNISIVSAVNGGNRSVMLDSSQSVGIEAPRLWGQLITEDNTSEDSFRRTYSGQYLWKKMHGK